MGDVDCYSGARRSRRRLFQRPSLLAAGSVFFLTLLTSSLDARPAQHTNANEWDHAVALRQQLEDTPANQRTREQFEEVLDSFRTIYHRDPMATKAPAAVAAVADLLAEKGRVLMDRRVLRSAIGQYEFLRQQYPDSPQVENALLLEGEICLQDLKDLPCAQEKFRAVADAMPGTSFAEQANLELKGMESGSKTTASTPTAPPASRKPSQPSQQPTDSTLSAIPQRNSRSSQTAAQQPPMAEIVPPPPVTPEPVVSSKSTRSSGHVVTITGMRHWSNPTSTRIAIDLGGKVEFEAARVPNPERIFFDLHGARLAPSLNGRQVEVVDDGYLKRIRAAQFHPDVTRVVLDVTDVSQYSAFLLPNPWRLIIDIHSDKGGPRAAPPETRYSVRATPPPAPSTESAVADVASLSTEPAKIEATTGPTSAPVSARVKSALPDTTSQQTSVADSSPRPAIPSTGKSTSKSRKKAKDTSSVAAIDVPPMPHAAEPTADGQRSLVRALGLKVGRIVIDAGHGGHDSGTLGPGGIQEKDVVLDVALRTGKLLHQQLGAEIVYTRDDDTFIPLETRTAIANKAQADLFLSIHGNSSPEPSARGVETYYLNFTSDPNALEVAARENAVSTQSVHQLSDLVRKITLKDKIDESREFAADVDEGLFAGLKSGNPGLHDRGVKKAPFVVLIGAQMPSILAEISFLTNPDDAEELRESSYRQRIAQSLASGVERYLRGLSGTRPVEKAARRSSTRDTTDSSTEPAGN
jgi:N-acetylmuramoyl-L-alanine amidase